MSALFASLPDGFTAADPRADGAIRHIAFQEGRVLIARRVRGVAMRLDIPCSSFRGVVLSMDGVDDPVFTIRLDHQDPELSVVVHEAGDDADVIAQWRAWSKLTGLPKFLEREAGVLVDADEELGALRTGRAPAPRRRGAVAVKRRPRFLTRRRMGERQRMIRLPAEREIIARD
ncbi:MAG: hypothetical protein JWL93_716 [Hyphomicrobiales bacterium]|jgi:hypothetical protein|nr:hypothetical protein [Hyphomicrobiales bacterium]